MKRYNPAIRNILFVCYNITLVNYVVRRLLERVIDQTSHTGQAHFRAGYPTFLTCY